MSDDLIAYWMKIVAWAIGITGAIVGFFKGFQTKAGCATAHKLNRLEQVTYRELVNVKLANIKDDVSEIKKIIQAQYGTPQHLEDSRRTDRNSG